MSTSDNQIGCLIACITTVHAQYQKNEEATSCSFTLPTIGMTIANPILLTGFKCRREAARVAKTDPDVFLVFGQEA